MRPESAWLLAIALLAATAAAFVVPAPAAVALALLPLAALRRGRVGYAVFLASAVAINALLLGVLLPGPDRVHLGPLPWSSEAAWTGAVAGARLSAAAGVNLAALSWIPLAVVVDGLRLPRRAHVLVAAVAAAASASAGDLQRLVLARRLDGSWPRRRLAQAAALGGLLPPLLAGGLERARERAEALRLAGIATPPSFAALVAVAALAAASRMAMAGIPNVSLAYVVVFLGGLVWGWRVGAGAAALSMLLTDLALSGLNPSGLVNVPAMALIGWAGAWLRPGAAALSSGRGSAVTLGAASATVGIVAVLAFSVVADAVEVALVLGGDADAMRIRVGAGLAFNALPALANGVLFAAAVPPVLRARSQLLRRA